MISSLRGKLISLELTKAHIEVGGVGYSVSVTTDTVASLQSKIESVIFIHTYLVVREDALDLYGFSSTEEQDYFKYLISISGIGPKTGLAILSLAGAKSIRSAVASGDASRLTSIPGIGKKNAEKIILELKDKITSTTDDIGSDEDFKNEHETIEALVGLGYSERDARTAVKKLPPNTGDTSEKLKAVLKILSK